MLKLCSLEVEGFGPYAEQAVLQFPQAPGVTVVYGDNMRGKTSLMNAIRYAFFGEVHGRGDPKRGILSACNRDLAAEGRFGFTIALSLRYDGQTYDVVREAIPRVAVPQSDDDFTRTVAVRRAGGVVLGPAERDLLIRSILPKGVARFFLFDGELLSQYEELLINESEEGRGISESIEQILGVPLVRDGRDHLAVLASRANRASAKEASRHQKTQAIGVALAAANDAKDAHERERDRKKLEVEELIAERDEIMAELRRQEIYAAAVERLDMATKELDAARKRQIAAALELKSAMAEAWRTVLSEPVRETRAAARVVATNAVDALVVSMRIDAISSCHCGTCDQDVPQDVRDRLAATLPPGAEAQQSSQTALNALARASELDGFREADVSGQVQMIWNSIRQARIDEADALGRIADAQKTLDGKDPEELRRRRTTLTEVGGKLRAASDAVEAEQGLVDEQVDTIARLSKRLEDAGTPELAGLQQRERVFVTAGAIFAAAVERYKAFLRSRVERTATELFLQMTTEKEDYASLSINDHYGLTIMHRDGRTEDSRSAGAEQVVALALMGALQANAPLSGPIVMDTPFGRLDPHHTANVVMTLPSMAEQVVLLIQEGEVDRDTVRKLLGTHLLREYQLDKQTARRTIVVPAR